MAGRSGAATGSGLAVLVARWPCLLAGPALALAATLLALQLHPREHVARAQLLLGLGPAEAASATRGPARADAPSLVGTQLAVLRSDAVAQRVAGALAEHDDVAVRSAWQQQMLAAGSAQAWAEQVLPRQLAVQRAPNSRVVHLLVSAADPALAAATANAAGDALLHTLHALQTAPASRRLAHGQAAVAAAAGDVQRTQRALAPLARVDAPGVGRPLPPAVTSPLMADAAQRPAVTLHAQALASLQAAQQRWGNAHPQMQALQARALHAADALRRESDAWSGVAAQDAALQRQAETLAANASRQAHRLRAEQGSALREAHPLQREAQQALQAYQQLQARTRQARLAAAAPLDSAQWLARATAAEPSAGPWLGLGLSLVLGGVASLGLVLLLELRGPRVRSRSQAAGSLALPLLGVLAAPVRRPPATPSPPRQTLRVVVDWTPRGGGFARLGSPA